MIFPAGKTFRDQGWGAVIEYEDTGHISDEEAAADYNSVLIEMKSATERSRTTKPSPRLCSSKHLIGWAQQPTYDSYTKTLIWARNIQFEGQENTLNYDVRMLGRTAL